MGVKREHEWLIVDEDMTCASCGAKADVWSDPDCPGKPNTKRKLKDKPAFQSMAHKCACDLVTIQRYGCQCGGK